MADESYCCREIKEVKPKAAIDWAIAILSTAMSLCVSSALTMTTEDYSPIARGTFVIKTACVNIAMRICQWIYNFWDLKSKERDALKVRVAAANTGDEPEKAYTNERDEKVFCTAVGTFSTFGDCAFDVLHGIALCQGIEFNHALVVAGTWLGGGSEIFEIFLKLLHKSIDSCKPCMMKMFCILTLLFVASEHSLNIYIGIDMYFDAREETRNALIVGGDADEHGCIASAGYSWCETEAKCYQSWAESCSSVTLTTPAMSADAGGYFTGPASMNFDFADAYCQMNGGHLASISNQQQHTAAASACAAVTPSPCFIGLQSSGVPPFPQWAWTDGTPLQLGFNSEGRPTAGVFPWVSDAPNDYAGSEDCVEIYDNEYEGLVWNDVDCNTRLIPLCRKEDEANHENDDTADSCSTFVESALFPMSLTVSAVTVVISLIIVVIVLCEYQVLCFPDWKGEITCENYLEAKNGSHEKKHMYLKYIVVNNKIRYQNKLIDEVFKAAKPEAAAESSSEDSAAESS